MFFYRNKIILLPLCQLYFSSAEITVLPTMLNDPKINYTCIKCYVLHIMYVLYVIYINILIILIYCILLYVIL